MKACYDDDIGEMRCVTCRWWEGPSRPQLTGPDGQCNLISDDAPGSPEQPDIAWTSDVEGFSVLMTRPDFGCVLWEPHDTEGTA